MSGVFLGQLRDLLPLDDESLQQVLDYSNSLSRDKAAEHLTNLLGGSPGALDFISSFNARRLPQSTASSSRSHASTAPSDGPNKPASVPKPGPRKKKAGGIKKLPPVRQVEGQGDTTGFYIKKDSGDYLSEHHPRRKDGHSSAFSLTPDRSPSPAPSKTAASLTPRKEPKNHAESKLPPSAAGRLISDPKPKPSSQTSATKGKVAKVSITGGTPMQGQSTALSDLESAIRELEVQTNPTFALSPEQNAKRRCNCMATRHDLLASTPNCLKCGKIICVKEGIGPCTFCGTPLLSAGEIDSMIRVLREERGKEKTTLNNAARRRADVAATPRPFAAPADDPEDGSDKLAEALQHRDKLLAFQAQNATRTKIRDEAADFETPSAGLNAWASPAERALQLKKQQKILREQEWNARPEWEKRKVVASIDLVGGKVVRRMATVARPPSDDSEGDEEASVQESTSEASASAGRFAKNPLLGKLIRPMAKIDTKGKGKQETNTDKTGWRRVQDSQHDNEEWILDGGGQLIVDSSRPASDEPACG
jgi:hypothetical protein